MKQKQKAKLAKIAQDKIDMFNKKENQLITCRLTIEEQIVCAE